MLGGDAARTADTQGISQTTWHHAEHINLGKNCLGMGQWVVSGEQLPCASLALYIPIVLPLSLLLLLLL